MKIFRMKILIATWGDGDNPSRTPKCLSEMGIQIGRCSPFVIKIMRQNKSLCLSWFDGSSSGTHHVYRSAYTIVIAIFCRAKTHLYDDILFLKLGGNYLRLCCVSINGCWLVHLYCLIFRVFALTGFRSVSLFPSFARCC